MNSGGSKACTNHYIEENDVAEYVLNDIRAYAVLSAKQRQNLSNRLMFYMRQSQNNDAGIIQSKINQYDTRLSAIETALKNLYVDKTSGELTPEEYKKLKTDLTKEQLEIADNLPRLRRELDLLKETTGEVEEWLDLIERCMDIETLDRETVTGLIDRITVSERVKVDGKSTQELEISYRFIGNLLSDAKEDAAS